VSKPGGNGAQPERAAFDALERAVGRTLARLSSLNERLARAEGKGAELEELLRQFTGHEVDPGQIVSRLRLLEEENTELRSRVDEARSGIERLLAKIRFLEDQQ
jgi:predicted RNase H-like nuclease (RuvC/YqgF family)